MKKLLNYAIVISIIFTAAQSFGSTSEDTLKTKAKKIADQITDLRSEKASSLLNTKVTVTPDVFKSVCSPVKKRAMAIAKKEGVKIRHAAIKNRNPGHAATKEDVKLHDLFSKKDEEKGVWEKANLKDGKYIKYSRPIYVEKACLACHGEKDKRPDFIKKKYPQDKAYGFKEGDLRGIIQVMVPITE